MRLLLATRNPHKLREFSLLLSEHTIEPVPPEIDLPPETGMTFAENALAKARAVAAATGADVIADDSGIQVPSLGGAPGVRSARFAGEGATDEENLEHLLAQVSDGAEAEYVCALAFVGSGGVEQLFEGRCRGVLTAAPRGSGGFGYDPAFLPVDDHTDRTMAELEPREKDAISHRGRAAREFLAWLATR